MKKGTTTHTEFLQKFQKFKNWDLFLKSGLLFAHSRAAQVDKQPIGLFWRASGQTQPGAQVGKHTYPRVNLQFLVRSCFSLGLTVFLGFF